MESMHERDDASYNAFQCLGLSMDAGDKEIRAAYFAKVKLHSPERDPEGFKRIRSAYEMIKDEDARVAYCLNAFSSPPDPEEIFGSAPDLDAWPDDSDIVHAVLSVTEISDDVKHKDKKSLESLWENAVESFTGKQS